VSKVDPPSSIPQDASISNPVRLHWEGNPFIKTGMLKSDVLNLNGANNAALKLCELAAQHNLSLTIFSGRSM
jgi:hypothetical protein